MKVRNLVSWAGEDFSHAPGDVIELPDDIAEARKAAGLAEEPPATQPAGKDKKTGGGAG